MLLLEKAVRTRGMRVRCRSRGKLPGGDHGRVLIERSPVPRTLSSLRPCVKGPVFDCQPVNQVGPIARRSPPLAVANSLRVMTPPGRPENTPSSSTNASRSGEPSVTGTATGSGSATDFLTLDNPCRPQITAPESAPSLSSAISGSLPKRDGQVFSGEALPRPAEP